jgi:hypothetical protein
MSQPPPNPPPQNYTIQVERKLSPLQNTFLTVILAMGALLLLFVCCVISIMIISGLLGLGLFGAILSQL